MEDWLSKDPIMAFEPKVHEGRWIPGLEIYSEEEFPDGWAAKIRRTRRDKRWPLSGGAICVGETGPYRPRVSHFSVEALHAERAYDSTDN